MVPLHVRNSSYWECLHPQLVQNHRCACDVLVTSKLCCSEMSDRARRLEKPDLCDKWLLVFDRWLGISSHTSSAAAYVNTYVAYICHDLRITKDGLVHFGTNTT